MSKPIYAHPHDVQQEDPAGTCDSCNGEIWSEEHRYFWDGKWVCLDCFKEAVTALLKDDPRQLALEMQIEVERLT